MEYALYYLAVAITVVSIAVGWVLVKYVEKIKQHLPMEILPSGWSFYLRPTSGEPPGTVFRITPDKKRFIYTFLDVKIHPSKEVTGTFTQSLKANMNILARFLELKDTSILAKAEKVQDLVFEMKNPVRETTTDTEIKPLYKNLVESLSEEIIHAGHERARYYVIRDTCKTEELNYKLTEKQVEHLGGETSLSKALETKGEVVSAEQEKSHVIIQKFDEPMRVMFIAEEIMIKPPPKSITYGGYEPAVFLGTKPVKKALEWNEDVDIIQPSQPVIVNGKCSNCGCIIQGEPIFCPSCGGHFKSNKKS